MEMIRRSHVLFLFHAILLCFSIRRSHVLFLFHAILLCFSVSQPINETNRLALLEFENRIAYSTLATPLDSWNNTLHFCQWKGVTCSPSQPRQVIKLELPSLHLFGSMSPAVGNLTGLQVLNLGDNDFNGEIPEELGRLTALRILNLSNNAFSGPFPANLTRCRALEYLDLNTNGLVGEVPDELAPLSKLDTLYLFVNNFTGTIPPSIGNLSSLTVIGLGRNGFQGRIPEEIGRLKNLTFLQVGDTNLTGEIPESIYNLSSLTFITFAGNQIHGTLPLQLGHLLPNLETLYLGGNLLRGPFPNSLINASALQNLDLAYNNFTGPVWSDLGRLGGLLWLNLNGNRLGTGRPDDLDFLPSLVNCTGLQTLGIDTNGFGGTLPDSVTNFSTQLSMFLMGGNHIHGPIPPGIGNLVGLTALDMSSNMFGGSIPASIGQLQSLQFLSLSGNRISGAIPESMGNLTGMNQLSLRDNNLSGKIPSSLENCHNIQSLDLSQNNLEGPIPPQVIGLSSLSISLSLAHNSLSGSLPSEVGNLKNIGALDISDNNLSGEIPSELKNCQILEYLSIAGNSFQGSIPSSLRRLRGLQELDLSRNNLSGRIPEYLGDLQNLYYLNLSFNDFEGEVPRNGVFVNTSALSVIGNNKLCGGITSLHLPSCPTQMNRKQKGGHSLIIVVAVVVPVSCVFFLLCLFVVLRRRRSRKNPPLVSSLEDGHMKVSYAELLKVTDGFSSANLIGAGSFGSVYRGTLANSETVVAVKVLNLQNRGASKSFMAECEALRNIRHRNLIKIITTCSSIDFQGNDFKALVFEFMPNGSLDDWLHPGEPGPQRKKNLSIIQRLNIIIDVASSLDYLHHQCQATIVHCDLKPSNVLLDDDMTARLGDFGLAKFLFGESNSRASTSSIGIKGSIGYTAPEYSMGCNVSTQGDVYSYGILLLEMLTGKRPTDDTFKDGMNLHNLANDAFPEQVMEIIDPHLLLEVEKSAQTVGDDGENASSNRIKECLVSMIGIGISCSVAVPKERMEMKDVCAKLIAVRDALMGMGLMK